MPHVDADRIAEVRLGDYSAVLFRRDDDVYLATLPPVARVDSFGELHRLLNAVARRAAADRRERKERPV